MLLLSFVHEDSRIVWAINKLQHIIAGLIANPIPPISYNVGSETPTSTSNPNFELMANMTLTPAAGKYLVIFSGDVSTNEIAHTIMNIAIFMDSTQIFSSKRAIMVHNPTDVNSFSSQAIVTVDGSQVIEGQWCIPVGSADNAHRTLTIVKVK